MKHIKFVILIVLAILSFSVDVYANDVCPDKSSTVVGFFNGITNTVRKAQYSLRVMASDPEIGRTHNGERIQYELFYNTTKGFWNDMLETYEMRVAEHRQLPPEFGYYYEYFWSHDQKWKDSEKWRKLDWFWDKLSKNLVDVQTSEYNKILKRPITLDDLSRQRGQIEKNILEGKKLLLVAHSQGNLYVNATFDAGASFFKKLYPTEDPRNSIKVVHVAPASQSLRGPYTLSDTDIVITKILDGFSGYVSPANIHSPSQLGVNGCRHYDPAGHSFSKIYMNKDLLSRCWKPDKYELPYERVKSQIVDALNALIPPSDKKASEGFFSVTLRWDGPGDIDLHVVEPNGKHVFYGEEDGDAGYLDYDNKTSFGPEHYHVSCDADLLQEGVYKIGVNNFSGGTGRNARIQVTSADGKLNYTSPVISVGPELGSSSYFYSKRQLGVKVSKDQNGEYHVEIVK